jgi:hypothetical protein
MPTARFLLKDVELADTILLSDKLANNLPTQAQTASDQKVYGQLGFTLEVEVPEFDIQEDGEQEESLLIDGLDDLMQE